MFVAGACYSCRWSEPCNILALKGRQCTTWLHDVKMLKQ